ncbi:SPOR domain-containing protein [Phenylobacterium sp. 20VBR1]|uniref:SPOR domain-containing protein n=1 Tax=Phenylobacterium glaciei TaxID=2803784 RepID=A0A941HV55_9CAUL|nr:SPOR domain-containing protein [Phenylobacterium glaciei]MBR7619399.1 SPOR domain-containing protein [Phenylobacterium glaciei]
MTNPDRGAYTPPTDAPLSFDARQPVRGSRPAPMMLIVSALVLIGLVVAIVVFYRSGVRQAGAAPQAVGTPVGAIKGPAPAEEQPVDPAAGLQIYQSSEGAAAPAAPNFTAPPEQPAARAPAPAVVVTPAPAAKPAAIPPQTVARPQQTGPVAAMPITPEPKPVPALKPNLPTPAAPKPVATAGGAASVQIGAFSSSALADKGWSDAARIAPGATAGKGKRVEAIQKDGATLYRTAVTGFASRADATAFCDQLKAAGKSCFVK